MSAVNAAKPDGYAAGLTSGASTTMSILSAAAGTQNAHSFGLSVG